MNSALDIRNVSKSFGSVRAVDDLSMRVAQGELLAVLGPSGCGKTTLLRLIAGFERADAGQIAIGGRMVTMPGVHLATHRRKVGVVPQDPSLFSHLSVAKNVAFGLPRGRARRKRIEECLELVGLGGLGDRMPHELSGGQQQRVAVARALAPKPPVVLLDEPFSALDASLRAGLRRDIRTALTEAGSTALLVTHDQNEALSMADRVAVMRGGNLLQIGTPAQVYREPSDGWVAQFVGDAMLLPVQAQGTSYRCALGEVETAATPTSGPVSEALALVRPEQVRLSNNGVGVDARVRRVDYHGHDAVIILDLDEGTEALMRVMDGPEVFAEPGEQVRVRVQGPVRVYGGNDVGAGTYTL